jgi:hypothetical protein
VRVAIVETWLRRFELKAAYEIDRRSTASMPAWGSDPAGRREGDDAGAETPPRPPVRDLLERVVVPPPTAVDTVAVPFAGERGFVRILSFPFKAQGQIAAALPMQMIGQVPIQPEDVHCAFERIHAGPHGTDVLAVAVPRADFAAFVEDARAAGHDPAHVTMDGICLFALLPYLDACAGARMLVWAEGAKADIVVADGLKPVMARSIALGEPVLRGADVSPALLREVLLTAASASEAGATVGEVRVAGPGAAAMAGPIGEALGAAARVLDPGELPIPGAATCPGLGPATAKAVAVALAAASGGGPGSLDLRTGAFSIEESHGLFREHYRFFVAMMALVAVLGVGRAVARYVGLNAERDVVTGELKAFTTRVLGREREDFDGVLKTMKAAIEEDFHVFPRWTATDTLNRVITAAMSMGAHVRSSEADAAPGGEAPAAPGPAGQPKTPGPSDPYAVEIESARIEARNASVRGEADSIETLDGLVAKLKSDPCFHDVVTESTERIQFERHQGWQRFSLRFAVDCAPKEAPKKPKAAAAKADKGVER